MALDFPATPADERDVGDVAAALRETPRSVLAGQDALAIFGSEAEIRALVPDMEAVTALACRGVIATAPGDEADFVLRFFAPDAGIPEDPVTGSAYCTAAPYWSKVLDKRSLYARQLSRRGGEVFCEDLGDRVRIAGRAVLYMRGSIELPDRATTV